MTNIKIAGLPNSSVTLRINDIPEISLTPDEFPSVGQGSNSSYIKKNAVNDNYLGMGLNFQKFISGSFKSNNTPGNKVTGGTVAGTGTSNNVFVGSIVPFSTHRGNALVGAKASVIRVVNGVPEIWNATITACSLDHVNTGSDLLPQASGSWSSNKCVQNPSAKLRFQNWILNREYRIGIAAVEADGKTGPFTFASIGTISSFVGGGGGTGVDNTFLTTSSNHSFGTSLTLTAPTNVQVSEISAGLYQVTCDAVSGAYGYIVSIKDVDPSTLVYPGFQSVTLSGEGDFNLEPTKCQMIISNEILNPSLDMIHYRLSAASGSYIFAGENGWGRNISTAANAYQWKRFNDTDDQPPTSELVFYMRRRFTSGGADVVRFNNYWIGTATDIYYTPWVSGQQYTASVWVRGDIVGNIKIRPCDGRNCTLSVNGAASTTASEFTIPVTTSWQKLTLVFTVNTEPSFSSPFIIRQADNTEMYIDFSDWHFSYAGNPSMDVSDIWNDKIKSGMMLRDQSGIFQYASPVDYTNEGGQVTGGRGTFKTVCEFSLEKGTIPWLMPAFWSNPEDSAYAIAYLISPVSSNHPAALKRQAQGRTAPWTDDLDIIIELANEPWNLASGYIGPAYGMKDQATSLDITGSRVFGYWMAAHILEWENVPGWAEARSKLNIAVAGHIASSYGSEAAQVIQAVCGSDSIDTIVIGYYLGGDNQVRTQSGVGFSSAAADGRAYQRTTFLTRHSEATALGLDTIVYEGSTGYSWNRGSTAVDISDECIGKSRAAGSGTLDGIMQVGADGGKGFAYFDAGDGDKWSVYARESEGGGSWIAFDAMSKLMEELGAMKVYNTVDLKQQIVDVTIDQGAQNYSIPAFGIYLITSIEFPDRKALIICPRDIDRSLLDPSDAYYNGSYVVPDELTIYTTFNSATSITKLDYRGDFREHNRYPPGFRKNSSTGAYDVVDPLCVTISEDWEDASTEFPDVDNIHIENMKGGPLIILYKNII